MPTQPSDKQALLHLGRRFAWISLAIYGALILGLWAANALFPDAIGPVTDYSLTTGAIAAVTFGGLFAAALALWPGPSRKTRATEIP